MYDFTRKNVNYRYKPYVQSRYFDRKLLKFWTNFYEGYGWKHNFKAQPGLAGRPGWPGAGTKSGWWKNGQGFGPVKPGRSDGSTRENPTETRLYRAGLMKKPVRDLAR